VDLHPARALVFNLLKGSNMRNHLMSVALLSAIGAAGTGASPASAEPTKSTTIVLVHGAYAGSSSWNNVVAELTAKGYPVVAAANPLRSVKGDADYVSSIVKSIKGPVVLVGHSYGGAVIANAANGNDNVKGLVFVSGLAPEAGESAFDLVGRFPGSTLGGALAPDVLLSDGSKDSYIDQSKFWAQFCADVPEAEAINMAVTQRPVTEAALKEPAGQPAWKTLPSWFIYGSLDKNIPPAAHAFMAKRAGAKETVEVKGSSHVVMISHPREVVALIEQAASTKQAALAK
jgi:pimeloyl-ACP methyl ester carboxylesterase